MNLPSPLLFPPARIFLNRIRRRFQKVVEALLDDGVALARRLFEAEAIENLNGSPMIVDKAFPLQCLRRKCHRLTIDAQHLGQKLMRERQIFAVGPIMHHEEPPADLLLSCVQGVTRDCLLNLSQQRLGIADKKIANVRAALEFQSQHL